MISSRLTLDSRDGQQSKDEQSGEKAKAVYFLRQFIICEKQNAQTSEMDGQQAGWESLKNEDCAYHQVAKYCLTTPKTPLKTEIIHL